jgi:hypothetical protein
MAQHDLGGSCTAHRYCHSEARISGQVVEEHGGLSEKSPTMIELTFCIKKRQSSYSHSVLSTFSGGSASLSAMSLSTAMVPFEPIGCVRKLWSAFRCSVSWKAESICALCQHLLPAVGMQDAHLRKIYKRRTLCHVLRLGAWPYPSRRIVVEVAKQLLLLRAGRDRR